MVWIWAVSAGAALVNLEFTRGCVLPWKGPPACNANVPPFSSIFRHSKLLALFRAVTLGFF